MKIKKGIEDEKSSNFSIQKFIGFSNGKLSNKSH
jgi:hypothetical protein